MTIRKELLEKAKGLGLVFPKNIPTEKLEELVIESMEKEVTPPAVTETPTNLPEVKDEAPEVKDEVSPNTKKLSLLEARRNAIKVAREKAFATRIITLTNKDNRENDVMTTAYLSFENQHFGLSKLVPLDIAVELEEGLISVAKATTIPLHKDEIVDGRRTGNKVVVQVKKFAISYGDTQD